MQSFILIILAVAAAASWLSAIAAIYRQSIRRLYDLGVAISITLMLGSRIVSPSKPGLAAILNGAAAIGFIVLAVRSKYLKQSKAESPEPTQLV